MLKNIDKHAMVITNDKELMVIGGFQEREDGLFCASRKNCYILKNGQWKYHSSYQKYRMCITAITMPNGIYMYLAGTQKDLETFANFYQTVAKSGNLVLKFQIVKSSMEKGLQFHQQNWY